MLQYNIRAKIIPFHEEHNSSIGPFHYRMRMCNSFRLFHYTVRVYNSFELFFWTIPLYRGNVNL